MTDFLDVAAEVLRQSAGGERKVDFLPRRGTLKLGEPGSPSTYRIVMCLGEILVVGREDTGRQVDADPARRYVEIGGNYYPYLSRSQLELQFHPSDRPGESGGYFLVKALGRSPVFILQPNMRVRVVSETSPGCRIEDTRNVTILMPGSDGEAVFLQALGSEGGHRRGQTDVFGVDLVLGVSSAARAIYGRLVTAHRSGMPLPRISGLPK